MVVIISEGFTQGIRGENQKMELLLKSNCLIFLSNFLHIIYIDKVYFINKKQ